MKARERDREEADIGLDCESHGSKSRRSAMSSANTYRLLSEKNRIDPSCLSVTAGKEGDGRVTESFALIFPLSLLPASAHRASLRLTIIMVPSVSALFGLLFQKDHYC